MNRNNQFRITCPIVLIKKPQIDLIFKSKHTFYYTLYQKYAFKHLSINRVLKLRTILRLRNKLFNILKNESNFMTAMIFCAGDVHYGRNYSEKSF